MVDSQLKRFIERQSSQALTINSIFEDYQKQIEGIARYSQQYANQIDVIQQWGHFHHIINFDIPKIDTSQFTAAIELANQITQIAEPITTWQSRFDDQIGQIANQYSDIVKNLAIDFAAIEYANSLLPLDEIFQLLSDLGDSEELADAFNSAKWTVAPSMSQDLKSRVVALFRAGKSRYISNAIIGYYHRNKFQNLKAMVESWREHPLFKSRIGIIDDAVDAHQGRKFTLSVPTLQPQIEGILNDYVAIHNLSASCGKIKQVYKAVLGEADDYTLTVHAIAATILSQLAHNTYVHTDFREELKKSERRRKITRHTVLHGISTNYNTTSTSLRILVLLDAIAALHPQISSNLST